MRFAIRRPAALVALAAAIPLSPAIAAFPAQTPPAMQAPASTPERLKRIAADLFGPGQRVKESIQELKQILGGDPRSADAHFLLGVAYSRLGAADLMGEATAEFRQALALNPSMVQARYFLARLYLDMARPARAREELEAGLAAVPGHPQFLALLADAERVAGNAERSADLSRQALAKDPSFAEARYYLALALLALDRREEAIRELEQVAKSGAERPEVYSNLGVAYLDAGRLDEGLAALQRAAALDPARPQIRVRLARAYREKGLLARADAELARAAPAAVATQTSSAQLDLEADLHVERGRVRLQQGRLDAAIASFTSVLERAPDDGRAHRFLAEAYLRKASFARALEHAAAAEKHGHPLPADLRAALDKKRK